MGKVFWSGALSASTARLGSGCTRSSARSSSGASDARRSPARTSSPFATCSFATSRTGRSRARDRAAKHARRGGWIEALGRPQDHAELLAHHYLAALELDRSGDLVSGEIRDRAAGCAHGRRGARVRVEQLRRRGGLRARRARPRRRGWPGRPRLLFQLGKAESSTAGEGRDALLEAAQAFEASGDVALAAEARVLLALGRVPGRPRGRSRRTVWSSQRRSSRTSLSTSREGDGAELSRSLRLSRRSLPGSTRAGRGGAGDGRGLGGGRDPRRGAALRRRREVRTRSTFGARRHARERRRREVDQLCCPDHALVNNLSIILRPDGDVQESIDVANEGLAVAERFGMRASVQFMRGGVPFQLYERGTMG